MIPLLLAGVTTILAIGFSLRQLWTVVAWPDSDPDELLRLCAEHPESVGQALQQLGPFERSLGEALTLSTEEQRFHQVQDTLVELELRYQRGARVPVVAARVSSSVGFLASTLFLRQALVAATETGDFGGMVLQGVGIVSVGLCGALTCAAIHRTSQLEAKRRLNAFGTLCDHLAHGPAHP